MTNKDKLKELLKKREAVTPVSLYSNTESTQNHKTTSTQHDKTTKLQVDGHTKPQVDKRAYTQHDKTTSTQVVKYTTHLKQETIKAIKRYAVEAEIKDYELVQEAVESYLKGKKTP